MTSGSPDSVSRSALGLMFAAQWISTNASVLWPSAPGSTIAVKPVITPPERSRSTRRLTAGEDRLTRSPSSARLSRPS